MALTHSIKVYVEISPKFAVVRSFRSMSNFLYCLFAKSNNFSLRVDGYSGRQETVDLPRLNHIDGRNAAALEATSPLLNAGTVPMNHHYRPTTITTKVDPDQIHLYAIDGNDSKKLLQDGHSGKLQQVSWQFLTIRLCLGRVLALV